MNLGTLLTRNARFRGDHPAVVFEEHRLTFRQFDERVTRLSRALSALGLRKDDKLAVILPNCLELLDVYWAAARTGIVVVPLGTLLRGSGLITLLRDSDSSAVITCAEMTKEIDGIRDALPGIPADRYIVVDGEGGGGYRPYREWTEQFDETPFPSVEIDPDDPYNIIYTSGTTGSPKGIVHTHRIRGMYATLFANAFRMTPESVVLHAGSLVFNGAFVTLLPAMHLGATYVLQRRFEPSAFIQCIARERATHLMMVPSQIIAMMNAPEFSAENLRSLEMLCTVGAPLHAEHKARLARTIPGVFYELYGLTEGFVTILDKNDYARKPGSVGSPPQFFEMRIAGAHGGDVPAGTVGEIVGRGPILMPGYYKRPDLTALAIVDGWLYTGDLGYADEDGFLYLVDRKKDLIISGGVNVFPKDIEEILVQHPAVREAAVFGVPDDKWGEVPIAAVILGAGTSSPLEIRDWVNTRVAARYQQVKDIVIMEDFPRSSAGKTLKRVMRDPYWAGRNARI